MYVCMYVCMYFTIFELEGITKFSMTGPGGNS